MIQIAGDQADVSGPMTIVVAAALTAEGSAALSGELASSNRPAFNLAAVTELDSSALAIIFAWMRVAKAAGKSINIVNPPPSLLSLAAVYGVADLLPQH